MNILTVNLEIRFVPGFFVWQDALTQIALLNQYETVRQKTRVETWRIPSAVELQIIVREGVVGLPFGFYWSADIVPIDPKYVDVVEINSEREVKDAAQELRLHPAVRHSLVAVRFI